MEKTVAKLIGLGYNSRQSTPKRVASGGDEKQKTVSEVFMNFKTKRAGAILAVVAYATTIFAGGGIFEITASAEHAAENEGLT